MMSDDARLIESALRRGRMAPCCFYLGRHLTTLWTKADFESYVVRPGRRVVVLNQENWER